MITATQTERTALTVKHKRVLLRIDRDVSVLIDFGNQTINVDVPADVPYEILDPDKEAACRKPN